MIIFKITNILNNKVYINYKKENSFMSLNRIKNKEFKHDLENNGKTIFEQEIVFISDNKEDVKTYYKQILQKQNYLYNKSCKETIVVKDHDGKNIKISINDERYKSGELKHVSYGKIMVIDNETNKYTTVYKEDPLYKIRYIPVTTGKMVAKDINNNHYFIDKNDERLNTKELVHISKGTFMSQTQKNKLLKTNILKRTNIFKNFPYEIEHINSNKLYKIKNFCKHGDLIIKKDVFTQLYKLNLDLVFYCEKCKHEFFESYNKTSEELQYYQSLYKHYKLNLHIEEHVKKYIPILYFYINDFIKHTNLKWEVKVYMFKHNMQDIPLCMHNNCNKHVNYSFSLHRFNLYCSKHFDKSTISIQEIQLLDFIKSITNKECLQKYRKFKKEIDIYIPELKLGFEFNGVYWHSDKFKSKDYHYQKWKLCNENDVKLIYIWEDDWKNKQKIVKSNISANLNAIQNIIYARKCIIKKVNNEETKQFLNTNHLQGQCQSSIKFGLYYNECLVSLMAFGKKRMIMNQQSNDNDYELLRFCNKINTLVIGGASKLFKYFIDNYKPNSIISLADCSISNGNLYKILGFKEVGHTGLNYWWVKNGIRYHRSNFMKHKLVAQGYDKNKSETEIMQELKCHKIYGPGNLKYEWKNN